MMPYKITKVSVESPDGDTDYFGIVAGVLRGGTLASYMYITSKDYVRQTSIGIMKENDFILIKEISRIYQAQTITDKNYADDLTLLTNTPDQAESLLHSLEWQ